MTTADAGHADVLLGTAVNESEPPHIHRAGQDIGRHVGNQRKSVRFRRGMELDPANGFIGGVMKVSRVRIDISTATRAGSS